MELAQIRKLLNAGKLAPSEHGRFRLKQREITTDQVKEAIKKGRIIKRYPEDKPDPSYLILSIISNGRPLHVVVGLGAVLTLITAYWADEGQWEDDFETRRK